MDASLYPNCKNGDISKEAQKRKSASQLVAKEECSDCIFNIRGRCSKLNKKVVSNPIYNRMVTEKHITGLKIKNKVASDFSVPDKASKKEYREIIKSAYANKKTSDVKQYKDYGQGSNQNESLSVRTLESSKDYSKVDFKKDIFDKDIKDFISKRMYASDPSHIIREDIKENFNDDYLDKTSNTVDDLLSQEGLLGTVYISYNPFKTSRKLKQYLNKVSSSSRFLLSDNGECPACKKSHIDNPDRCHILDMPIHKEIPNKIAKDILSDLYNSGILNFDDIVSMKGFSNKDMIVEAHKIKKARKESKKVYSGTIFTEKGFDAIINKKSKKIENSVRNFVSNSIQKGITGYLLKESIRKNFSSDIISSYRDAIASELDNKENYEKMDKKAFNKFKRFNKIKSKTEKSSYENLIDEFDVSGIESFDLNSIYESNIDTSNDNYGLEDGLDITYV